MTAGDGDAEQLRVPRWIAPSGSSDGGPGYGSDDPEPATRELRDPNARDLDDPDLDDRDLDDRDLDDRDRSGRDRSGRDRDDGGRDGRDRDRNGGGPSDRGPDRRDPYDRDRNGRDTDDDDPDGDDDEFGAQIYVPRRYSPEADDGEYAFEPDFDDIEYPVRPARRGAWKDTLPSGMGADRYGADNGDGDDDRPRGRRHAAVPRNRRLVIAWIAAAVVIAVALPLGVLFFSSSKNTNVGAGGQRTGVPPRTEAQPSVDGVSIPGSQPTTGAPSDAEPTGRSNAAPNPGQFGPVTYEAETNTNALSGSATVVTYPGASGGDIVRNIGDWGLAGGPGTLRFQNVDVPAAGAYSLTFFHVNIDNERVRTAVITVDGVDPILVTITGSSNCCLSTTIRVTLKQGRNSITFSNNSAHAPSIDKITISQP